MTSPLDLTPNGTYLTQVVPLQHYTSPEEPIPQPAPRTHALPPFNTAHAQQAHAHDHGPPHHATYSSPSPLLHRTLTPIATSSASLSPPLDDAVPEANEEPPSPDTVHLTQPDETTPRIHACSSCLHTTARFPRPPTRLSAPQATPTHQPATSPTTPLRTPTRPSTSAAGSRPTPTRQAPSTPLRNNRSRAGLRRAAEQQQPPGVPLRRGLGRMSRAAIPRTVPPIARALWSRAVTRTLEDIVDAAAFATGPRAAEQLHATLDALADLPLRVLADKGASSGRGRRTVARLARWEEGLTADDDEEDDHPSNVPRRKSLSEDQKLAARIQSCLSAYSITRGARALAAEPLADTRSATVLEALRQKHPQVAQAACLPLQVEALQITGETLKTTLKRLEAKRGAAAGPTSWTYEHVSAAAKASTDAFAAIVKFVNLILSGELPRHSSLLDSSLIGLQKPDGGVRPIAIGEVWYRLAGLCALTACNEVGQSLAPLQLGVGVPGGAEAVGHAVQAVLAKDPEAALLTVDQANAFNSVSRSAVFEAVNEHVPALLPFVQWAYGAATNLLVVRASPDTPPILSQTGVRQGDPLGPLLFALALQRPLQRTRDGAPNVAVIAFADDVSLVGRVQDLKVAFEILQGEHGAGGIGLQVQHRKCALTRGPLLDVSELAAELDIQHCPNGITVCGTPIGTNNYVANALLTRATSVVEQITKLMKLPLATQSQFVLLRSSLSLRMVHLQRSLPWDQVAPSTRQVEQAVLEAISTIFRLPSAIGPEGARVASTTVLQQMVLPLRHGGLGLRMTSSIEADAALLSGAAMAEAAMYGGKDTCMPFNGASRPPLLEVWRRVFDDCADDCGWGPDMRNLPDSFVEETLSQVQHRVSRVVGDREGASFLAAFDTSTDQGQRGAARMLSAASGPSAGWVTALPGAPSTRLSDADFVLAGRHLFGLGTATTIATQPCPCGARDAEHSDHAMACKQTAGMATLRHDIWASAWRRAIRRAGCATSAEPSYSRLLAPGQRGGAAGLKRGDILAILPGGRIVVLDCVITHPAAASYARGASQQAGFAAAKAEANKRRAFEIFGDGAGYEFLPLAGESFGRLGKDASRFLNDLGEVAASDGCASKSAFVRTVRQELSCALCKGNARMYDRSLLTLARGVGRGFVPGLERAIDEAGDV